MTRRPVAVSLPVAAELLGLSDNTLRRMCVRGEFPHVRVGTRYLIRVSVLDEWLAANEQGGGTATSKGEAAP